MQARKRACASVCADIYIYLYLYLYIYIYKDAEGGVARLQDIPAGAHLLSLFSGFLGEVVRLDPGSDPGGVNERVMRG